MSLDKPELDRCPRCDSRDVDVYTSDYDVDVAYDKTVCKECQLDWIQFVKIKRELIHHDVGQFKKEGD
jgi:hypothetical protein